MILTPFPMVKHRILRLPADRLPYTEAFPDHPINKFIGRQQDSINGKPGRANRLLEILDLAFHPVSMLWGGENYVGSGRALDACGISRRRE
jgi:hypothetical protein